MPWVNVVDFQVAGAEGNGLRKSLRDDPVFRPASRANDMAVPSMGVETLGFDQAGAVETEPALAPVLVACSKTLCGCARKGAGKIQICRR